MAATGSCWREVQKRDGSDVENRLHCLDVSGGVGTDRPVGEHLVDGVGLGGALDLDGIGLIDGPGGETPQRGGPGGLVLVTDDGEQFGALAQCGRIAPGGMRAGS